MNGANDGHDEWMSDDSELLEVRSELRDLLAAAESGDLVRASVASGKTVLEIARSLARLETIVGTTLFVIEDERLALTEAGGELVAAAMVHGLRSVA